MDLFGLSIYNYWKGDKEPLYFINRGEKWPRSNGRYLRTPSKLNELDKKLTNLAYGEILDIGCATGNYVPLLMKKGKVDAIDISPKVIQVAQEKGLDNCHVADIFNYKPNHKYDTITLLENNLGMGGSIEKIRELLKILSNLLKDDGQILLIQRNISEEYYIGEITVEYKGEQESFNWVHLSQKLVENLCREEGLKLEILDKSRGQLYLGKITKIIY